jgi:putative transferase (TIGR04331 family)
MSKVLITSSDERLLLQNHEYIFLSEGCFLNLDNESYTTNSIVFPPYGISKSQKDADRIFSEELEEYLYSSICPILNAQHNLDFNRKQWQIVLGKWLRRYVDLLINRINTLGIAFGKKNFDKISLLKIDDFSFAAEDSLNFIWNCNNPEWNNILYSKIIDLVFKNKTKLVHIPTTSTKVDIKYYGSNNKWKESIKLAFYKMHDLFSRLIQRKSIFILNSYLPSFEDFLVQLECGDIPNKYYPIYEYRRSTFDENLRNELKTKILESIPNSNIHTIVIFSLFFEIIPKAFLEDFNWIKKKTTECSWPVKPKIIFTSNHFDFDEVFKIYSAFKVKTGSKYVIGQHGNNYGTYRYMYHTNEEKTADAFLTWGWKGDLKNHYPCFIFKKQKNSKFNYYPEGDLILIQLSLMNQFETWDLVFEHKKYFESQIDFVSQLPKRVFDKLIVRLHRDYKFQNWNEPQKWNQKFKQINLDFGSTPILKLTTKAKLVVHSYDSTGLLETLFSNIPTMAFWLNDLDHLQDEVIEDYRRLAEVGILHFSNVSILNKIESVWDNLDKWWASEDVQSARINFCSKYARDRNLPAKRIAQIFKALV